MVLGHSFQHTEYNTCNVPEWINQIIPTTASGTYVYIVLLYYYPDNGTII